MIVNPMDLVQLSIDTLKEISVSVYNYNEFMDFLKKFKPMEVYIEGENYIIPIEFDFIQNRYSLNKATDYNILQTTSIDNSIHERFFVKGTLLSFNDEIQLDLTPFKKYVGNPISEYQYKELEERLIELFKRKMDLMVFKYYNTLLYIFQQILQNNTVIIDGITINIPFIDNSGNTYPRVNLGGIGINLNFSSNTVNPEDELLKARDYIRTQKYILELNPSRFIVLLGEAAWYRFKNNVNILELRKYWSLNMEQEFNRIKPEKYKRELFRKVMTIEDMEIYVQDPSFMLKINGNNVKFMDEDDIYIIALIDNNFVLPYNTGNYFIGENPVMYRKVKEKVEIIDTTPVLSQNIVSVRNYKVLGSFNLNCLFTHAIGYGTTS